MEKMTKEKIISLASNIMFELTDAEVKALEGEFENIQSQMEFIGAIEGIDEVEPQIYPYLNLTDDDLREDIPENLYSAAEILSNAGKQFASQVVLPKVVL